MTSVTVLPFRRPKKKRVDQPAAIEDVARCSVCGWRLPTVVRADRSAVKRPITLSIDCPECGANLILMVEFT
jgi:predicted RNA-binding Zn-ribbon protein involved in translation (DUF1610 family)